MCKIIFFSCIFLFCFFPSFAQENLAIPLDHPVYTLLEIAELKGAIDSLSKAKPYSVSRIIGYLEMALEDQELWKEDEITIIRDFLKNFKNQKNGITHGNIHAQGDMGSIKGGINTESILRSNLNDQSAWHMNNILNLYLAGDIGKNISYYGSFGVTYDRVCTAAFVPYGFSKNWDGFHINFIEPRYSLTGEESVPYFSFMLENEITMQFFSDDLALKFARFRRDWGIGDGCLFLSETARPFEAVELHVRPVPGFNLSYLIGSLGDWSRENQLKSGSDLSFQKMLTIQLLEFFPFTWLYLSVASSAIWGKRFELGYLNPLMYPVIHQNLQGDYDNVTQSVNIAFKPAGIGKLYFSFFADEMEIEDWGSFFTRPRNMFAWQVGTSFPIPFLSIALFTFQYTDIEPFVYSHYPETHLSTASTAVDLSYTHDGENLGYYLPPNSDEFLFKLHSIPITNFLFSLEYKLIRHGTNDYDIKGDLAIYGDVNINFIYGWKQFYPDKNFLNDGLYDWNNIVTAIMQYTFPQYPISIALEYSFSHTHWEENQSDIEPLSDEINNILGLQVKIFR